MNFRIGRILELLQAESVGCLVHQLLAFVDRSGHALQKVND